MAVLTPARANILAGGISSWKLNSTGDASGAYQPVPQLREGKITIDSLSTMDSQKRPIPFAYDLKASVQFFAMRTSANFIKLLDTLLNTVINHKITMINGQIFSSAATSMSPTGFGTELEIVSDKDMNDVMYIQMNISRILTRLTLVGALFLGVIAVLPLIMSGISGVTALSIGGTSLLIVVSVVIDLIKKIDAQVSIREY